MADGASRQQLFRIFFFSVFAILLYQLIRIFSPFFTPLLVATTLSIIFFPLHARVRARMPARPNVAAVCSTGLILLIVIVPLILFAWLLVKESAVVYPAAQEWAQSVRAAPLDSLTSSLPPAALKLWDRVSTLTATWEIDTQDIFLKNVDQIGKRISAFGAGALKNLVFLVFDVLVTAFTLFFFFRDGPRMGKFVSDLVPMEQAHKELVLARMAQTLSAVVRGVFITASVQGLLAGIGYAAAGVRFSVLLGFATAFMALVPFVGATAVWLPVALYMGFKVSFYTGVGLVLWGALVVSLVDNFMRPILIGEKAKLPVFLLFFGILGGLQVYGFIGILMGPLMIATVLAFAKIYREQFHKPAGPATPS